MDPQITVLLLQRSHMHIHLYLQRLTRTRIYRTILFTASHMHPPSHHLT